MNSLPFHLFTQLKHVFRTFEIHIDVFEGYIDFEHETESTCIVYNLHIGPDLSFIQWSMMPLKILF